MSTHDPIHNAVIDRIKQRAEYGKEKHGTETMLTNTDYTTSRWIQEAQDELLDLAAYLERIKASLKPTVEDCVKEFDTKFNLNKGTFDSKEVLGHRIDLISEEYKEVLEAVMKGDKENFLKELCDLVYVTVGTATLLGLPFDVAFARVHASNMSKQGLPVPGKTGKVIKGADYKPASLTDLV